MFKLLKEALKVFIWAMKYQTLEKICYGATAYGVEQAIKFKWNESQRMQCSLDYAKKFLVDMPEEDIKEHLDAMNARLVGVGANPNGKVA